MIVCGACPNTIATGTAISSMTIQTTTINSTTISNTMVNTILEVSSIADMDSIWREPHWMRCMVLVSSRSLVQE